MKRIQFLNEVYKLVELLRWNKPSGRLILLIPAGWSLWLAPSAPPNAQLILQIIIGGILVSGAGCVANDLWDKGFDKYVKRTQNRPLAKGEAKNSLAITLIIVMVLLSLLIVFTLPSESRYLSIGLAALALPIIIFYPTAKRWFPYPQAILAICWGFAVLIPWAASESNLFISWTLLGTWLATVSWTFGFDTIYAMADRQDDERLGLNSSAIRLGKKVLPVVAFSYFLTSVFLAIAAFYSEINLLFWPFWLISSLGMQYETWLLKTKPFSISTFGNHFKHQVWLGSIFLLGLIISVK